MMKAKVRLAIRKSAATFHRMSETATESNSDLDAAYLRRRAEARNVAGPAGAQLFAAEVARHKREG